MSIEDDIREIADKYIPGVEGSDYTIQPVIHINDLNAFIEELLETFDIAYK